MARTGIPEFVLSPEFTAEVHAALGITDKPFAPSILDVLKEWAAMNPPTLTWDAVAPTKHFSVWDWYSTKLLIPKSSPWPITLA